jgi:hypothetical protein
MAPVTFTFENGGRAEASTDCTVIWIPRGPGPNEGVECILRSASEKSYSLGLAADHIMAGNNVGPVAVAHTEGKPTASIGGLHPREFRRWVEFNGGMLRMGDLRWIINRPGLPVDTYDMVGCAANGDWGEERNTGSLPGTAGDFVVTRILLNGLDLLGDPAERAT